MAQTRLPPQDLEVEQSILGAILIENDSFEKCWGIITEADFYRDAHRKIFSTVIELRQAREPIDLLTLAERLRRQNLLEEVGGMAYLASLVEKVPTAANVKYHAKIIRDKAILRNLIHTATEIATESYEASEEADEILDRAERRIFEIGERRALAGFVHINQVLKESFETIDRLLQRKRLVTGVPTGFIDFDIKTAGLQPGDLVIIAARPSMGKTAFCLNVAQHVGIREHLPVAIFSLEMSKEQLAFRLLCAEGRLDSNKLRTGFLDKDELPQLTRAAGILSESLIYIDDSAALTPLDIRARSRRLQAEHGLSLVIIDYLQLLRGRGRTENRQQEIADTTRSLKALAKELNVPLVAISQLSRAVEQRTDRRPQLSDLRESGAIEQDADVVAFLYRDEVYNEETPDKGIAEVILSKQRNGPIGTVKLAFHKEITRFENLMHREEIP
ncbi:MAG: replicative DNA helicase [Candidatus Tectomicrobia bacterium]|uniref:Replicative DNA helicase n=1 Tax=Tectimicrobiota bacterium TaxID=2528274 RepID=A0A932CP07_UNCTE|nr:replicative DNA helicase [Candidatus Tectomicrobia bacterium]